jgi:hypothetical protein
MTPAATCGPIRSRRRLLRRERWSEDDCADAKPLVDGTEFADADDAFSQGKSDGYDGAFDLSPAGELCYGRDCWTSSDY